MKTLWDYGKDQEQQIQDQDKLDSIVEDKIESERLKLISNVSSYSVNRLRDKVAWLLNHYPEVRDSDIALQLKFWETYESDIYNGRSIKPEDMFKLTRLTSIARERAKIQNVYKLFVASSPVRKMRGTLSEDEKGKSFEDKPPYPFFVVYMDDSGKTANNLLIGSVWFLHGGYQTKLIFDEIRTFRDRNKFNDEFHFKEMKPNQLSLYKEFLEIFINNANAVSFKLISVARSGVGKINDAFADLYYHLLVRGIEHEHQTGRAPLPRNIQVWKDAEELGADRLLLANLEDRLKQSASSTFNSKLGIGQLLAVPSDKNPFLQVADLLTSSANRVLNRSGEKHNHKDEFAEFFLEKLEIDLSFNPNSQLSDQMIYISL